MSTVFVVKDAADASQIREVEANILYGTIAETAEIDGEGNKVVFKPREFFLTREDATNFLGKRAEATRKQRLKNLPDQYQKAVARVAELRAEMEAEGIQMPAEAAEPVAA